MKQNRHELNGLEEVGTVSECKVCSKDNEPLYEPPGLQTRLTINGNILEMLEINLDRKTKIEINYCPVCGRSLNKGN